MLARLRLSTGATSLQSCLSGNPPVQPDMMRSTTRLCERRQRLYTSATEPPGRLTTRSQRWCRHVSQPYSEFSIGSSSYQRRGYANGPASTQGTSERDMMSRPDSIFSPNSRPSWDQILTDLSKNPPMMPPSRHPTQSLRRPTVNGGVRRQAMTAREISAFDEMFNMIFNAVSQTKNASTPSSESTSEADSLAAPGIGRGADRMGDLFTKLKRHAKNMKWTTETDELLDRKKEEMDLCDTDHQLLEWAMREVFGESKRHEEAVRRVVIEAAKGGKVPESMPLLQPATYPHLVARLMRSFRDKYNDPHLALSIFDHARHLSIASYVFGCTTPAYNELIETRWRCFRDLRGVCDALNEMVINGVPSDVHTGKITEELRRELGERTIWEEDSVRSGEVLDMLDRIELLMTKSAGRRRRMDSRPEKAEEKQRKWSKHQDWKVRSLDPNDTWVFDQWEDDKKTRESHHAREKRSSASSRNPSPLKY